MQHYKRLALVSGVVHQPGRRDSLDSLRESPATSFWGVSPPEIARLAGLASSSSANVFTRGRTCPSSAPTERCTARLRRAPRSARSCLLLNFFGSADLRPLRFRRTSLGVERVRSPSATKNKKTPATRRFSCFPSGRRDSNSRPHDPEPCARPNCATPRWVRPRSPGPGRARMVRLFSPVNHFHE